MLTSKWLPRMGLVLSVLTGTASAADPTAEVLQAFNTKLAEQAKAVLHGALAKEKGWSQVRAADALNALGDHEPVRRAFEPQRPVRKESPSRIGELRALAGSARTPDDRATYLAEVEKAFLEPQGKNRIQAIETLAKLGHVIKGEVLAEAKSFAATGTEAETVFVFWALYLAGDREALPRIVKALESSDPVARLRAAFVLRWEKNSDPQVLAKLAKLAVAARPGDHDYDIVVGSAYALNADPAQRPAWRAQLEHALATGSAGARANACFSLRSGYKAEQVPKFQPVLEDPETDTRIAAAWAILHVLQQK